jgi:DNA-binding transcriptional LysR family regulator
MVRKPSLLDLVGLVPSADLAKAARMFGLGPDALKKRIASLESALGLNLVETATRTLKPREAGRLVIDHATRIFSQARDLTRDLEELAGLQEPELHFGTDMFVAELPLGTALGRMASANSRLRVHAVTSDFEQLARDVLAGKLEFAVADTTGAERHPTRFAIEPVAEHRVFFFVRDGHPLTTADALTLEALLAFPLVAPRLPQRIASHVAQAAAQARVDRDTGDLEPGLMVEGFEVARAVVLAGNAVGLAPLGALETDLRANRVALLPFDAPWLHLSYGLFHPRKKTLSRAAHVFMTQLRQVEAAIQAREQRALLRLEGKRRTAKRGKSSRSRPPAAASRPARSPSSRRRTRP